MTENSVASVQDAFFSYAKDKTSLTPKKLADFLRMATNFCHLKHPILGMTDIKVVRDAYQKVAEGKLLRIRFGKDAQAIRNITQLYYTFIKNYREPKEKVITPPASVKETIANEYGSSDTDETISDKLSVISLNEFSSNIEGTQNATGAKTISTKNATDKYTKPPVNPDDSGEEWIIARLKKLKLTYQDKRNLSGCLWIIGGHELDVFMKECKSHGYEMHYKPDGYKAFPGKAAWWTTSQTAPTQKTEQQRTNVNADDLDSHKKDVSLTQKVTSTQNERTIIEAVFEALKMNNLPMTFQQIDDTIIKNDLYCFNTSNSIGMIRHAVYTHCQTNKERIANGETVIIQISDSGLNKYQLMTANEASLFLYGKPASSQKSENELKKLVEPIQSNRDEKLIAKAEKIIAKADLDGMSVEDLANKLNSTVVTAKKVVAESTNIITIDGRLIHKDAFMDWEENADILENILNKLMTKNNGYVSYEQLYDYARMDMQMFINDHNMDTPRKIYDFAEHLFDKEGYHGTRYSFIGKTHISRKGETVTSKMDIMKKFARDNGGIFTMHDMEDYLTTIGVKNENLRQQMKLYEQPVFLYIDEGTFITAESMGLNAEYIEKIHIALKRLFSDGGDHIVLRDIQTGWFSLLPALPQGKEWTPLLLQSILRFYGKECGARTIYGLVNQAGDTLHAMVVSNRSEIQTFGDAVIAMLLDSGISRRHFEAEELRHLLVDRGMVAGNELIWNMPKALPNDGRFAWDSNGQHVTINI